MRRFLALMLAMVLLLTPVGCGVSYAMTVVKSDTPRETDPQVDPSELEQLVNGNTAFAFDLYHNLSTEEGNLFLSPYSISVALAMTYAGACGETESQMANTLHFTLPQDKLHAAFNALNLALAQRGEGAKGKDGQEFRLNVVNALWGQEGYEFLTEFLDTLAKNYDAGLNLVDFIGATEEARNTINRWVSDQTEARIEDIIPQGALDALTRLVLTNAIYLNAAWLNPFAEESTADGAFHLLDGSQVTVPMMHQTESFSYTGGDGYKALELLYDGSELSMVVLLPDEGDFAAFEAALDAEVVKGIVSSLEQRNVAVTLPRFEFDAEFSLKEVLGTMGMPVAFSTAADFSGMTGNRDLMIGNVLHKSFVSADEAGTEAAAATAVEMELTAAPEASAEFNADRPFVFLIRDIETEAILFVGRVTNPAS